MNKLFKYELCMECGLDKGDHTVCVDPVGNFFAKCNPDYSQP